VLAAIEPQKRAAMWRDAMAKGATVHLAERTGAIVGFGSSGPRRDASLPPCGEIYAVYVLRAVQRRGIGRALMSALARDLLAQGHVSGMLWVLEGNASAQQFYQVLGGRIIDRREQQREGSGTVDVGYGWDDLTVLV
jgi:ribosomal protein S18 acetylase RimI-like enzyme